jgi:hypothetical protein
VKSVRVIGPTLWAAFDAVKDRAWEQPGIEEIRRDEELRRAPLVRVPNLPGFQLFVSYGHTECVISWRTDHYGRLHCRQVAGVVTSCKPNGLGDLLITLKVSIGHQRLILLLVLSFFLFSN